MQLVLNNLILTILMQYEKIMHFILFEEFIMIYRIITIDPRGQCFLSIDINSSKKALLMCDEILKRNQILGYEIYVFKKEVGVFPDIGTVITRKQADQYILNNTIVAKEKIIKGDLEAPLISKVPFLTTLISKMSFLALSSQVIDKKNMNKEQSVEKAQMQYQSQR